MHQFSFGAVADVHHLDEQDRIIPHKKTRFYRNSLNQLNAANIEWKKNDISFIYNLGDTLDGKNFDKGTSYQAYEEVMSVLRQTKCPLYQVVGNHELYNFSHTELQQMSHCNGSEEYISIAINENYQLIGINCFDISVLGYKPTHAKYREAELLLKQMNHNEDKEETIGLEGMNMRFVNYNGGVGKTQLLWLENELQTADNSGKSVIMMGHLPIHPQADVSREGNVLWNYNEVLRLLHQYQCVKLYIAGHVHTPAMTFDTTGMCHMTLTGVIETLPGECGHYTFHVYDDRIAVIEPTTKQLINIPTGSGKGLRTVTE